MIPSPLRAGYVHNNFHSAIAGITNSTPDGSGLFVRDFSILGTWTRTINANLLNQVLIQVVPRNSSQALPNADNGINFSLGNLGAPGSGRHFHIWPAFIDPVQGAPAALPI